MTRLGNRGLPTGAATPRHIFGQSDNHRNSSRILRPASLPAVTGLPATSNRSERGLERGLRWGVVFSERKDRAPA
jgi:hypothetical protein